MVVAFYGNGVLSLSIFSRQFDSSFIDPTSGIHKRLKLLRLMLEALLR